MKELMIDYRDANNKIFRKTIDNMEFCVRHGKAYFFSGGKRFEIPLELVIQVYTN